MENDVDFLAFVPDFKDDFEDLTDLADEVLDIEAMVVLIVELDRPCSGSMSAVPVFIALGWVTLFKFRALGLVVKFFSLGFSNGDRFVKNKCKFLVKL